MRRDELLKTASVLNQLRLDIGRLNLIDDQSRLWMEMQKAAQLFKEQESGIAAQLGRALQNSSVATARERMNRLLDAVATNPNLQGVRLHPSWHDAMRQTSRALDRSALTMGLCLSESMREVTLAESILASSDFAAISRALKVSEQLLEPIKLATSSLVVAFDDVAETVSSVAALAERPAFFLPGTTREVLANSYVLRTLDTATFSPREEIEDWFPDRQEYSSDVVSLLRALNPELLELYKGAHDARRRPGHDCPRHVFTSLRELWAHLLRNVAPETEVMTWVSPDQSELLHEGRPTRRAKVLYVCRDLGHSVLSDFADKDTTAFLEYLDLFNSLHKLNLEISEDQLDALLLRTDSWLLYILQIANNNHGA